MDVTVTKVRAGRRRWQILITRGRKVRVITCTTKAEAELTMKALDAFFSAIAVEKGVEVEQPVRGKYIATDYYNREVYENDLIRPRFKVKVPRPATFADYDLIMEGEMIREGD